MLLAYHNGRTVPQADLTLSYADAGFAAGATVTDFCRTHGRRLFRWPAHLARLRRDCGWLGVELTRADADLTAAADALVRHNAPLLPTAELALVTFCTPGPLGYLLGGADGPPTVGMHTLPLDPARYARFFDAGVTLAAVGTVPDSELWPAAVKHRSRVGWYQAGRSPGLPPGAVAALLTPAGVADTAIGSVVVVRDGAVLRPPAGTVLDSVSLGVLAEACARAGLGFAEQAIDFRALVAGTEPADEVWLTGTGFGVAGVRVAQCEGRVREWAWPGPGLGRVTAAWEVLTRE